MQRLERFERGRLDGIGDAHQAGDFAADEDEHHRLSFVTASVCRLDERTGRAALQAQFGEQRRIAQGNSLAIDHALNALAGDRLELVGIGQFHAALFGAADDRLGQRMFRATFEAGGKTQYLGFLVSGGGQHRDQLRLADGQRPGLVDDQGIDLRKAFERLGILYQHASLRATPGRGHDRHRRRQAERAGAGDDQHRDGCDQSIGKRRRRSPDRPGDEGQDGDTDHRRHELAGDRVGELLDRRARALRVGDHVDDLAEHGVTADPLRFDDQRTAAIDRRPGDGVASDFLNGHSFTRNHRLVDRRTAFDYQTIHRHLVARPHPHMVADDDFLERYFLLTTVGTDHACCFGGEIEQRADRRTGTLARA